MNSCSSQRFLIFLRQTSNLRRLQGVNDRNSRHIFLTRSAHTTLSESSLKDSLKDSQKLLPYGCRTWLTALFHILCRRRLYNSLSWGDLFLQFSILCDRPHRLHFFVYPYSTRHFFGTHWLTFDKQMVMEVIRLQINEGARWNKHWAGCRCFPLPRPTPYVSAQFSHLPSPF